MLRLVFIVFEVSLPTEANQHNGTNVRDSCELFTWLCLFRLAVKFFFSPFRSVSFYYSKAFRLLVLILFFLFLPRSYLLNANELPWKTQARNENGMDENRNGDERHFCACSLIIPLINSFIIWNGNWGNGISRVGQGGMSFSIAKIYKFYARNVCLTKCSISGIIICVAIVNGEVCDVRTCCALW